MSGELSEWTADSAAAASEPPRPAVHEYQVATPLPGELGVGRDAPLELNGAGQPTPSTVRELIARVEELLHHTRRLPVGASPGWAGTIQFGSVLLEPATQSVLRGGRPVHVTYTEFRLLLALVRRLLLPSVRFRRH